jgi:recombinational DNA repair protein RecT
MTQNNTLVTAGAFKNTMIAKVEAEAKASKTELTVMQASNAVEIINEVYTKLDNDGVNFSDVRWSQCNFPAQVKRFARMGLSLHDKDFYVDIRNSKYGGKTVGLWMQYQGKEKLLLRYCTKGGGIVDIIYDVVLENEELSTHRNFKTGQFEIVDHKIPDITNREATEKTIKGAYAIAYHKNGTQTFVIVDRERIKRARDASATKNGGPWKTDYKAMVIKTAANELYKNLTKFIEIPDDMKQDFMDIETDKAERETEANENAHRETFEADYNVKEEPPKFDEKTGEVIQESKDAKEPEQEIQEETYEAPF